MIIMGDTIILRAITIEDAPLLLELINEPETEKMLGGYSFPVSLDEQLKWIESQAGNREVLRCIVADKADEKIGFGTVILSDIDSKNGVAQVHIKMDKKNGRGKGYGTDALNTIVKYAFNEMRMNCIFADVLEYNIPSQRLFEKCGFRKEGILSSRVYKSGKYNNIISYSRVRQNEV